LPEPADEQQYDRHGDQQTRQKQFWKDELVDDIRKERQWQQESGSSENPARKRIG